MKTEIPNGGMAEKRRFSRWVARLSIFALAAFLSGCATYFADNDRWTNAKLEDSVESYESYLQCFPEGMHTQEAKQAVDTARAKREAWFPQEWAKVSKLVLKRAETDVSPLLDMLGFANRYPQHPEAQETLKKVFAFFQEGNTSSPNQTEVGSISLDSMGDTLLTLAGGDGSSVSLQRLTYPKIGATLLRVKYVDRDLVHAPALVELGHDKQYWTLWHRAGRFVTTESMLQQMREENK